MKKLLNKLNSVLTASNYFFSIFFSWSDIYKLFNIPEDEYKSFNIGEDYKKVTSLHGGACFEYYIIPQAWKGYYSYGHIFDQQNKTFSESPNTVYPEILKGKNKNEENIFISCGFIKWVSSPKIVDRKSCLWIQYTKETSKLLPEQKTLAILFDEKYLNLRKAYLFEDRLPCDVYLIEYQRSEADNLKKISKVRKIEINKDRFENKFSLYINSQSQDDGGSNPPSISGLYEYFKNNMKK